MRIVLAIHNAYTDSTSGAAQSMRILMQWLAEAGHECRVLGTGRFDAMAPDSVDEHLAQLEVPLQRNPPSKAFMRSVKKPANVVVGRPTTDFVLDGVPVTMLMTRAEPGSTAERFESQQFLFLLDAIFQHSRPELLITYGGHAVVQEAMKRARARGTATLFSLRNRGYEDRRYFAHVDYVLTTSPFLSDRYREAIGLVSVGIESPLDWADVEAPPDLRRFVTFVNPSPAKGSMLFARVADVLGSSRPDIPMLIVQSARGAGGLNAIPGLDFTKYPHIVVAPATPRPADFLALTRILLVPTVVPESFGRVAAEAMINGIPALVSDRGALPQTVGEGGRVIPLPSWMTEHTKQLPTVEEATPWVDAICELWDDDKKYERASEVARRVAEERFSEDVMRQRYLDYFATIAAGTAPPPFEPAG